jgi:hypothetical protein
MLRIAGEIMVMWAAMSRLAGERTRLGDREPILGQQLLHSQMRSGSAKAGFYPPGEASSGPR